MFEDSQSCTLENLNVYCYRLIIYSNLMSWYMWAAGKIGASLTEKAT